MIAKVYTAATVGFEGSVIEVEADMKAGLPSIRIVGMGNKSIDEARERVRSAIRNSLLDFPAKKITINLAPAELPKDGLGLTWRLPYLSWWSAASCGQQRWQIASFAVSWH